MIEHLYTCRSHTDGGNSCDCMPPSAAPQPSAVDRLAQRLAAMGDVLREAVNIVAVADDDVRGGAVAPTWRAVRDDAFRALADAVERAQPGAVEATRKALGR